MPCASRYEDCPVVSMADEPPAAPSSRSTHENHVVCRPHPVWNYEEVCSVVVIHPSSGKPMVRFVFWTSRTVSAVWLSAAGCGALPIVACRMNMSSKDGSIDADKREMALVTAPARNTTLHIDMTRWCGCRRRARAIVHGVCRPRRFCGLWRENLRSFPDRCSG